jgi:FkbM family methyltransferase
MRWPRLLEISRAESAPTRIPSRLFRLLFPPWTRRGIAIRRLLRIPVLVDPITVWPYYASRHKEVMFIQIGSHNGVDGDPLAKWIDQNPRWHGIMVEPVPEQFEALRKLRGDNPRVRLVRAAITDHDGTVDMTVVNESASSSMLDVSQLSSVSADIVRKHGVPESQMRQLSVPAMTFATLIEGAPSIDVLHIDAEGHDALILDQVDLVGVRPAVVMFESLHLSVEDRERCEKRLLEAGYRVVGNSFDTLGILVG